MNLESIFKALEVNDINLALLTILHKLEKQEYRIFNKGIAVTVAAQNAKEN